MSPTKVQSAAAEVCPLIASQTRRGCLCDPPHPGVGGMHLHHLNPLTEIGRGGSGPMSLPFWKHHPRTLQRLCRCLLGGSLHPPPPHKAWDHAIEPHPDAKLPRGRPFPLSPAEQKELGKRTHPPIQISNWSPCVLH